VAQVTKPAYLALIEAHGGTHSQSWKQKAKDLVTEHVKCKTGNAHKDLTKCCGIRESDEEPEQVMD